MSKWSEIHKRFSKKSAMHLILFVVQILERLHSERLAELRVLAASAGEDLPQILFIWCSKPTRSSTRRAKAYSERKRPLHVQSSMLLLNLLIIVRHKVGGFWPLFIYKYTFKIIASKIVQVQNLNLSQLHSTPVIFNTISTGVTFWGINLTSNNLMHLKKNEDRFIELFS